jgi:hypothetical protein
VSPKAVGVALALSGTCSGQRDPCYWCGPGPLHETMAVGGTSGCQWPRGHLAGKQRPVLPAHLLASSCLELSRYFATVHSEVPFRTASFPSWDHGSIEACDKSHRLPLQLSTFAMGN